MKLAPSLLASDLADLKGALEICRAGNADLIHFDVMDGHFVPNLSYGIPVLDAVSACTDIPIDVHLMVSNPGRLLDDYLKAGAAWISVHWEATAHMDRLLDRIRSGGARAGAVLNPATPVEALVDCLGCLDFVLLMSVNPGFGGQSFIPYVLDKARRLRKLIDERGLDVEIEIDGGVDRSNVRRIVEAGVDICVAGSSVFRAEDPVAAMGELRRLGRGND